MRNGAKAGVAVAILVLLVVGVYSAMVLTRGSTTTTSTSSSSSTSSTSSSSSTSSTSSTSSSSSTSSTSTTSNSIGVLNLGYFLNVNHAPAILGVSSGSFQNALGPTTTLVATYYPSGTQEIPLLVKGTLDMAFIGPDPAITAANQTGWKGITILAGVASGGAVFVVRNNSGITPGDNKTLGGKTFGAPGLGNTQDIALRYYLMSNGYCLGGSGCVNIVDASNSNLVTMFAQGRIDGAWVPEPYGEILMQQFGGKLFLDERSLWPGGNFSTAELVVRTQFLDQHPDVVRDIVSADVNETIWINNHLSQAETDLNDTLVAKTGQGYSQSVLNGAFARLAFTFDPLESSVLVQAEHAYALGDLPAYDPESIAGIYNLSILNSVLAAEGLPSIQ